MSAMSLSDTVPLGPKELAVLQLVFCEIINRLLDGLDGLKAFGLLHEGHRVLRLQQQLRSSAIVLSSGAGVVSGS
jgi:hypothetical protein